VPTIKCEECVESIRTALTKRAGVGAVSGDPEQRLVSVTFDPEKLTEYDIRAAVTAAGFPIG